MTGTITRDELVEIFVASGVERQYAETAADSIPADHRDAAAESFRSAQVEKDALRARLAADPILCRAVCPARTWKDATARYDTARGAVRLVEAAAAAASKEAGGDVTVTAIAQALIDLGGTVQDTIDTHGDDPRLVMWGKSYYAFRFRLRDAIEEVNTDVRREAERRRIAEEDARWAQQGLVRCDRCGGAGGHNSWPGWVCYGCDGRRAVRPEDNRGH